MNPIKNETEFSEALQSLDLAQQREVAVAFVNHVLHLCEDTRVSHALRTAGERDALEDELSAALKSARAATFDCHARCGAEGNWTDQAGYFVARAAVAAITPGEHSRQGGPAWQAAMSARMAYTSMLIEDVSNHLKAHAETEWQYRALSDYLNANPESN